MSNTNSENSETETSSSSNTSTRRRRKRKDGKNVNSIVEDESSKSSNVVKDEQKEEKESKVAQAEVKVEVGNGSSEKEETIISSQPTSPSKTVQLQVRDVRDIVSGVASKSSQVVVEDEYEEDDDEYEEDDDDEYEYYYEDEDNNEVVIGSGSRDSSLESLLADAKRLRKEEVDSGESEESGISIPSAIRSVISTIVTVDFFVVCALLAWFLAGIFCSYIVKDDTVQIAFNGIFEPVVQPALGVLMIGSAAGAVFNDEEKKEEFY